MSTSAPTAAAKPLCFVIGPIGGDGTEVRKHADFLLHGLIKHVLEAEEFGYRVKRADEDADPGMISDRMISDILNAELVVADLTGLNANAFYELGIRHAAERPVIHIAKAGTVLPFDNLSHRAIQVDLSDWASIELARQRLAASARHIKDPTYRVSNPITQANASFKMRGSADPRDKLIADMQARMEDLETAVRDVIRKVPTTDVLGTLQRSLSSRPGSFTAAGGNGTATSLPKVLRNVLGLANSDVDRMPETDTTVPEGQARQDVAVVAVPDQPHHR